MIPGSLPAHPATVQANNLSSSCATDNDGRDHCRDGRTKPCNPSSYTPRLRDRHLRTGPDICWEDFPLVRRAADACGRAPTEHRAQEMPLINKKRRGSAKRIAAPVDRWFQHRSPNRQVFPRPVATELLCKSSVELNGCLTNPHHLSHGSASPCATRAFHRYAAVRSCRRAMNLSIRSHSASASASPSSISRRR